MLFACFLNRTFFGLISLLFLPSFHFYDVLAYFFVGFFVNFLTTFY